MSRSLPYINFIGVLALAALCGVQWRTNRNLNLATIDLERARRRQAEQIADRDRTIAGNIADLEELRQRLTLCETQLNEYQVKLSAEIRERDQMTIQVTQLMLQRDQQKDALAKWSAAVAQRDAALAKAGEESRTFAAERNEAVTRFNDLAVKYNALVKDANHRAPSSATTRP